MFPIFSLPSKFGIGCFSKEAYEFADFLEAAGQGYWQILPIGPTGFGDSPYQPFSAFAGNPYFISPEALIEEGLLTWDEVNSRNFGSDPERVDYGALYENRYAVLRIAYDRWNATMMVQTLEDDGFNMVPFGQGFRDMSPPTKELMRIVLERKLNHGGHPVLRWNMDNAFVRTDPAGNLKIDKEKSTEKVDGAVALVMALDRAMKNQGGESVYDTRGLLII